MQEFSITPQEYRNVLNQRIEYAKVRLAKVVKSFISYVEFKNSDDDIDIAAQEFKDLAKEYIALFKEEDSVGQEIAEELKKQFRS